MKKLLAALAGVALTLSVATTVLAWGNLTLTAECKPDEATFAWKIDLPSENNFKVDWSFDAGFAAFMTVDFVSAGEHEFTTPRAVTSCTYDGRASTTRRPRPRATRKCALRPPRRQRLRAASWVAHPPAHRLRTTSMAVRGLLHPISLIRPSGAGGIERISRARLRPDRVGLPGSPGGGERQGTPLRSPRSTEREPRQCRGSLSEAFASIDTAAIVAIGRLDAVSDQLDTTIAACASADEWETAAEGALAGLDIGDPQASIGARCAEATSLVGAAICTEVGS